MEFVGTVITRLTVNQLLIPAAQGHGSHAGASVMRANAYRAGIEQLEFNDLIRVIIDINLDEVAHRTAVELDEATIPTVL